MSTLEVFLDIENAFDKMWQFGMLYKLFELKYAFSLIKPISSFLSQGKVNVSVEGEISAPRDIQAGEPQGSFLSPILCSTYINDMPQYLVFFYVCLLLIFVYMRQIAKRVIFSESCSDI
jgi:hypothetical protein